MCIITRMKNTHIANISAILMLLALVAFTPIMIKTGSFLIACLPVVGALIASVVIPNKR
jgi:hypothetical protein